MHLFASPPNTLDYQSHFPFLGRFAKHTLVRFFGYNPHEIIRPVRSALYFELFGSDTQSSIHSIIEEYPVWNATKGIAEFLEEPVPIPKQRDCLLYHMAWTPKNKVFEYFFSGLIPEKKSEAVSTENWFKHPYPRIPNGRD